METNRTATEPQTVADASDINPEPVVGGLATYILATDTYGCDVIRVTPTRVTLRERKATMVDPGHSTPGGFCAHYDVMPTWTTESDPNGRIQVATRRRVQAPDGRTVTFWKLAGYRTGCRGMSVIFGRATYYRDMNF